MSNNSEVLILANGTIVSNSSATEATHRSVRATRLAQPTPERNLDIPAGFFKSSARTRARRLKTPLSHIGIPLVFGGFFPPGNGCYGRGCGRHSAPPLFIPARFRSFGDVSAGIRQAFCTGQHYPNAIAHAELIGPARNHLSRHTPDSRYGSSPSRYGPSDPNRDYGRSRDLPVPAQGASVHARVSDHAGPDGRSQ